MYLFSRGTKREDKGTAEKVSDGRKSGEAIFAGGRNKRQNSSEIIGAVFSAEATGNFLFDFEGANITFSLIISERDDKIDEEKEPIKFAFDKAVNERTNLTPFDATPFDRVFFVDRVEGQGLVHNFIVSVFVEFPYIIGGILMTL